MRIIKGRDGSVLLDGKPVHVAKDFAAGKLAPGCGDRAGQCAKSLSIEAHRRRSRLAQARTKVAHRYAGALNWIEPAALERNPAQGRTQAAYQSRDAPKPATKPATQPRDDTGDDPSRRA